MAAKVAVVLAALVFAFVSRPVLEPLSEIVTRFATYCFEAAVFCSSTSGCLLDLAWVNQAFEGRYVIGACLGSGSRGEVFSGRASGEDGGSDRLAIKVVPDTPWQRIEMEPEALCKKIMMFKRYSPYPEHFCECSDYGRVTIGTNPYMYIVNSIAPGRSILDIGLGSPVEPPPDFPTLASVLDVVLEVLDIIIAGEEGYLVGGQLVRHDFWDFTVTNLFIRQPGGGVIFTDIDAHTLCTSGEDAPNPFGFRVMPMCKKIRPRAESYRKNLLGLVIFLMRYQHDHSWTPDDMAPHESCFQQPWHPVLRELLLTDQPATQVRDQAVAAMAEQLRPAYASDYNAAVGSAMFRAPCSEDLLYEFRNGVRDARALLR